MLIPVHICEKGITLPETGTYYVVASNGLFLHKDTGIIKGLVKVDSIPGLGSLSTHVRIELPKLPASIVWRCLVFFRRVFYQYNSESALVLWYKQTTNEYYLHCPRQFVSHGGVQYDPGEETSEVNIAFVNQMRQNGYKKVGTIHSHCDFGAFHSGVDTADEATFDGVHITIGNVNDETFSLASSLAVNNNRFQVDPQSVMLGIDPEQKTTYHSQDKWYNMSIDDDERERIINSHIAEIEDEWMPKVSQRTFVSSKSWKSWNDDDWSPHVSACVKPRSEEMQSLVDATTKEDEEDFADEDEDEDEIIELSDEEIDGEVVFDDDDESQQIRTAACNFQDSSASLEDLKILQDFFNKVDITNEDIKVAMAFTDDDEPKGENV